MKAKYIQTLAAQLLSLILIFFSLKLAASQFNDRDFGLYNVIRRSLAIINYPLLVGLGISLPIYLAKESERKEEQVYFISTAFIFFIFSLLFIAILNLFFPALLINLILGTKNGNLSWIIVFGVGNLYLYTLLYAIYRGRQEFLKANVFQVIGAGLLPVLAFLVSSDSIFTYFIIYIFLFTLVNLIVIWDLHCTKLISFKIKPDKIKENTMKFLSFGIPRVPGEFALFGLMSFPLFFVAKYDSIEMAGYVAIGFTLVQLVASLYEFLGTLLLPKSAQMASKNQYLQLKRLVDKTVFFSFITSALISYLIYIKLDFILNLIGKNRFLDHLDYSRMIIFCIPFYIIYLILRNPQDAISVKPYNTYNLCICFCLQLFLLIFSRHTLNKMPFYYASIIIPFTLLGLISLITWNRQIRKKLV